MSNKCVYGLSSLAEPELGIRYIGLTTRGAQARLQGHLRASATGTSPCYRWIRRVGTGTIVAEVLATLPDSADLDDLFEAEAAMIREHRARSPRLLNLKLTYDQSWKRILNG